MYTGCMATPSKIIRPATYQDLLALPENLVGEILAGELHASPRPRGPHAVAMSSLGGELVPTYGFGRGGPGGWWIIVEPELHLGGNVMVPDLAGWRRERMPAVPKEVEFTVSPDWVCEILSPSTERKDRVVKLPLYAGEGVRHVWLVNTDARTLEVLRLDNGRWLLVATHGGDQRVSAEPFEAVEIDLLNIWGEIRPLAP